MRKFFFFLALLGWIIAFIEHILSIVENTIMQADTFLSIWLIQLAIFVVTIIYAYIDYRKFKEDQQLKESFELSAIESLGFSKDIPTILIIITVVWFFYCFYCFFSFGINVPGTLATEGKFYTLRNHGELVKYLTKQEYDHGRNSELRFLTSFLMVFYNFALLSLFLQKVECNNSSH